ncbi:MAG: hypothetical protein AAFS02_10325 [Pseudomonadota bacterium]
MTDIASAPPRLPLHVAVTGHRDLVAGERDGIKAAITNCISELSERYPEREVVIMSALAAGADQLSADAAREAGCRVYAVLPMDAEKYRADFQSTDELKAFEDRLARADAIIELPFAKGTTEAAIAQAGPARDTQYARLGVYLAAHCHVLIAVWDGKPAQHIGGTGHVVQFHHDDVMPGHTGTVFATRQMLIDDESDLVFHIVCSRDRDNGAPAAGLEPLETAWFTKDADQPRSPTLPQQHLDIFANSATFSRDVAREHAYIQRHAHPLADPAALETLPAGAADIDYWHRAADALATLYQRKVIRTLKATHALAFLMGACFILYADVQTERLFMLGFLGLFGLAITLGLTAKRGDWARKYLDYRALAEGLRVQFYWAVAGVRDENVSRFTHDNFLRTQDPSLGWIRNVMRVAGLQTDARPAAEITHLEFVIREWIGDARSGQLGYFERRASERTARHRITERLERLSLATSVAMVGFFVVAGGWLPDIWTGVLLAVMGALLLAYGIREGYAYAVAEKELIKQYTFMWRLFASAGVRLKATDNDEEKRQILRALGRAALDEHGEWLVMQRSRSVESSEVWRMSN